jgi:eukaryotic-like serine/threonine-protein kinase
MVYAATGRPAFGGDSVMAVMHRILTEEPDVSGVPPSLLPVLRDCLNKDPQGRPSARDLLLRLIDPTAPPAPTGSMPELAGATASTTPDGTGTNSAGSVSSSAAGQVSTPPAAGATIHSSFAGTWTGTATMSAIAAPSVGLQNSITFTLAKNGTTAQETNDGCINTLTLTKVSAAVLTFSEPANSQCVAGTVTFRLQGSNLAYTWTDSAGLEKNTATLHKK